METARMPTATLEQVDDEQCQRFGRAAKAVLIQQQMLYAAMT